MSKLVSDIDLNLTKSEIKSMISNIRLDVAFVVDANHGDNIDSDLSEGFIRAKLIDNAGTSEKSDLIYKPLFSNLSSYPLSGEYVIVFRHQLGNFYLSTINISNNENNNIDLDGYRGYVNYTDDANKNTQIIKSDTKNIKNSLENNGEFFNEDTLLRSYKTPKKFGDIVLAGRFGNYISFSHNNNGTPRTIVLNNNSIIQLSSDLFQYQPITQNIQYNSDTQRKLGSSYNRDITYISSERLFLESGIYGMFFQTPSNISFVTDDTYTIDTFGGFYVKSDKINLGYNSLEEAEDSGQQSILGNNFLKDLKKFVRSVEKLAENGKKDQNNIALKTASTILINDITRLGWDSASIENTFDRYLSKKVYIK